MNNLWEPSFNDDNFELNIDNTLPDTTVQTYEMPNNPAFYIPRQKKFLSMNSRNAYRLLMFTMAKNALEACQYIAIREVEKHIAARFRH